MPDTIEPEAIADLIADAACGDRHAAEQLASIVIGKFHGDEYSRVSRFCVRLAERFRELRRITGDPSDN